MLKSAELVVLVDNFCNRSGLAGEHGLSLLIEINADSGIHQFLLDAGQTPGVLLGNLAALNISLDRLRAVVLSHGHYDHTGGLLKLLESLPNKVPVLTHPRLFGPRLRTTPVIKSIGCPFSASEIEEAGGVLVCGSDPIPLGEGLAASGFISRTRPVKTGFSRVDQGALEPDDIEDELSLILNLDSEGLVIITGCCHAGLQNTIAHATALYGTDRIKALIGGFHLISQKEDELSQTIEFLKKISPELVAPLHCTGRKETSRLQEGLGDAVVLAGAGDRIRLF